MSPFGPISRSVAIRKLNRLVFVDQAQVIRWEVGEDRDLLLEAVGNLLVSRQRQVDVGIGLRQHGENLVAFGRAQWFGHAAGDHPSGMNALRCRATR